MSRCWSHPLLKSLVIAGYLLATTVSGLFHDHGGSDSSCTESCCGHAVAGQDRKCSATAEQSAGEKSHSHRCCHHHAVKKDASRSRTGERSLAAAKAEHGPCAVCQFLAHHHAVTSTETVAVVILPPPSGVQVARVWQPVTLCVTHPARGPPACA